MTIDSKKFSVPEYVGATNKIPYIEAGQLTKEVRSIASNSTQGNIVQISNSKIAAEVIATKEEVVSAHDVAAFILQQCGEMTAMKLQKLVYYSQAWSLVWDEEPLFSEEIEAWANGPVIRTLYAKHQGLFKIKKWDGNSEKLTDTQKETVLKVIEFYGGMSSQVLSDLTHREDPWVKARVGLGIGVRGNRVISLSDMAEYYSSL